MYRAPVGHRLSYVKDNNLHVYWLDAGEAQNVTRDGLRNHVINGVCDWVYEEEVLGTTTASWWSPDGKYLSFLRFEETNVPEYIMPLYQMPYNKDYVYKYPKAGKTNSEVTLLVYSTITNTTVQAQMPGT